MCTVNSTEDNSYGGVRERNKPSGSRKRISGVAITFTPKSAHKRNGIRDNVAGVETKLRNGSPKFESQHRKYIFLFFKTFRMSPGLTQPAIMGMGVQPGR